MSLLWSLAAYFLYAEVAIVLLLMLPIDPRFWQQRVFSLRILKYIKANSKSYFVMIFLCLAGLFGESIRQIYKYKPALHPNNPHHHHHHAHGHANEIVKEFRAQRNFYITGFTLFFSFVIKQLVQNISNRAELLSIKDLKDNQIKELNNSLAVATKEIEILRSEIKITEKERKTSTKASDTEIINNSDIDNVYEDDL